MIARFDFFSHGEYGPGPAVPIGREPQATIYQRDWIEARMCLATSYYPNRAANTRLLDHIEKAWQHLRQLELAYERDCDVVENTRPYAQVINFIDGDLVDAFRTLASDAALVVLGPNAIQFLEDGVPGIDELAASATLFIRYLTLTELAATNDAVPADMRLVVREVAAALRNWPKDLEDVLTELDRA